MKTLMMAAAMLGAGTSSIALAAKKDKVVFVEARMVADKPVVTLDPAKAYILVHSDQVMQVHLMRVPTAEDQANYDEMKGEAFAEAREKYAKKKASYDKAKASYDKIPKSGIKPTLPEEPVEPTADNFEFTSFGLMAGALIGPLYRFSKEKGSSVYVLEITPGTYRIYSASMLSCYCMGSVKFDAKAGELTDLGLFSHEHVKQAMAERDKSDAAKPLPIAPQYRGASHAIPLDPRLSSMKRVPAVLKPVGKLPNYFGMTIDRFPAVEGVMRYDRDKIVDLTAGN